jgi:hypothetical protein
VATGIGSWAYIFLLNYRLFFTPVVDEMPLNIMKAVTVMQNDVSMKL